jgi:hypothetical protein
MVTAASRHRTPRLSVPAVGLALLVAACAASGVGSTPPSAPASPAASAGSIQPTISSALLPSAVAVSPGTATSGTLGRARLEPTDGVLFGVDLDWGADQPAAIDNRLGRTPAVWVQFVGFPFSDADRANLAGFVDAVAAERGVALLTLEPNGGLATIDDAAIAELVAALDAAGAKRVDVLVRFAHEMNGSWYAWGEQPAAYVAAFRRVAAAVHAGAPNAAMLWAPNDGGGYPFAGGRYEAKPGTSDFALLDTNHDDKVTMADDPYAPYYPGDDAVDWVGMSLYHWGDRWPWGRNVLPEPGKFAAKLTGTYDGTAGDESAVPDFYGTYAAGHDKPMAIPETAAFYRPSIKTGASELAIKQAWWREVFSAATLARFPQIRLIDWFEQRKFETEVSDIVDWRLTSSPTMVDDFLADLPAGFRFGQPPN